ncbi:MAG: hypothetical protein ACRC7G_14185 [Beijerinckiaceae bacterium]
MPAASCPRNANPSQRVKRFRLDDGHDPQKYGIGINELWQVKPEKHHPGRVQHSPGWPLDGSTGGGFIARLASMGWPIRTL